MAHRIDTQRAVRRIQAHFEKRHRRAYPGRPAPLEPRALELVFREAGGEIGQVFSRIDRAFEDQEAVEKGVSIGLVFCRWESLGKRKGRAA